MSRGEIGTIWMVSREYEGLAGVGGVKDVCRQLAETLVRCGGCSVTVILPRYGFIRPAEHGFTPAAIGSGPGRIRGHHYEYVFEVDMDYAAEERREAVAVWQATLAGVRVFLIEADRYAGKRGVYTYTEEDEEEMAWQRRGGGHYDYFAMNILLQRTALDLTILLDEHPDIIHCQDGHAATLPAMMRENNGYRHYFRRTGAVVTIHNAGVGYHQEVGDLAFARAITGLPQRVILQGRLGGSFDPFISASHYAILNTVSENYGRELQRTQEDARTGWLGHALLERGVHLEGITNGIDPAAFDPTRPELLGLSAAFDVRVGDLDGKQQCKASLLHRIAEQRPFAEVRQHGVLDAQSQAPLITFIGRLTAQKGVDILIQATAELLIRDHDCRFLFFGSGAPEFEAQLTLLAESATGYGRICYIKGYDPQLANQVYAAGDFFLIPSRYEPCGLTDYIAQLLGNLPIVHQVGGLVKVEHGTTGFSYENNTPARLAEAVAAALHVFRRDPQRIRRMQQAAVAAIDEKYTWEKVMAAYLRLYRQALPAVS